MQKSIPGFIISNGSVPKLMHDLICPLEFRLTKSQIKAINATRCIVSDIILIDLLSVNPKKFKICAPSGNFDILDTASKKNERSKNPQINIIKRRFNILNKCQNNICLALILTSNIFVNTTIALL